MGFSYISLSIAGAIRTGHLAERTIVVKTSSPTPAAIFPIIFAVAGAIRNRSADFTSSICAMRESPCNTKVSV